MFARTNFKEVGIIVGYFFLLASHWLFQAPVYLVFLSFFAEMLVLIFYYCITRSIDKKKNPKKYRLRTSAFSILLGSVPLLLINYIFIALLASEETSGFRHRFMNFFAQSDFWLMIVFLGISYVTRFSQLKSWEQRERYVKEILLFQAFCLYFASMGGILIGTSMSTDHTSGMFVCMVLIRLLLELWFHRRGKPKTASL